MSLSGIPFIWNGIASEEYGISIMSINNTSYEYNSGSGVTFETIEIKRNPELLFYNASQSPVLSFPLEFVFEEGVDIYKMIQIKDWLFGELEYKRLQICLDGLETFYFNCQLKAESDYMFMQGYSGFKCTVECDSPFAWENLKTFTVFPSPDGVSVIKFNNVSADSEFLKPTIECKIGNSRSIKIINKSVQTSSGKNLTFELFLLQKDEIVKIDTKHGFIKTSAGISRFDNFNKNFISLQKGVNILEFYGDFEYVKLMYKNARRLGGGFY